MERENKAQQILAIPISTPELIRYLEKSKAKVQANAINSASVDISPSLNSAKNDDAKISIKKEIAKEATESKKSSENKIQLLKNELQKDPIKEQIHQNNTNNPFKIDVINNERQAAVNLNESQEMIQLKDLPLQSRDNEIKNKLPSLKKQDDKNYKNEKTTINAKIQCYREETHLKKIIFDGLNRIKNATENISKEVLQEGNDNELVMVDESNQYPEIKLKFELSTYTIKNQIDILRSNYLRSPCRFIDFNKIRKLIKEGYNLKIKSETSTLEIISIKNKSSCLVISLRVDRINNSPVVEIKKLEHNGFYLSEQLKSYFKQNIVTINQATSKVLKILEEFIECGNNLPEAEIVEID